MENTTTAPRLSRSTTDKVVAGVCGGLAAYLRIDPVVVRLAFLVFALVGGASILLYLALWLVLPQGDGTADAAAPLVSRELTAYALLAVGLIWLLASVGVFR